MIIHYLHIHASLNKYKTKQNILIAMLGKPINYNLWVSLISQKDIN